MAYIGHTENNMRGLTAGCNPKCLCIYVRDNERLLLLFYFSHTNAFVIFISIIYLHLFIFGSRVKFSVQNARKAACFIFYRSVTTSTQLEDRGLSAPHSRKGTRLLAYPRLRHSFLLSMFGFVYVSTSNSHRLDHSEKHYLEYPALEPKGYEAGM